MIKYFIPTIVLGVFLYMTFEVEPYEDRLNNLGFCLLAYISILEGLREQIPVLSIVTFGEKFIITFMLSSLIPILDRMVGYRSTEEAKEPGEEEEKIRLRHEM